MSISHFLRPSVIFLEWVLIKSKTRVFVSEVIFLEWVLIKSKTKVSVPDAKCKCLASFLS